MNEAKKTTGAIAWTDLTVDNAQQVRDFYRQVAGWKAEPVAMGDYEDFCMLPQSGGDAVAGICHARGVNAGLPPQWLIYITVGDLKQSIERCQSLGGEVLHQRDRLAVIKDPAGAVAALYEA